MPNTVPERSTIERESRESREFSMRNDERSLKILHRISLRPGPFQAEARRAFLFLERQKPGKSVAMKNLELGLDPEALEEIERMVCEERMLYGEETAERKAFREMRADVQETVREMKAQGDREYVAAMDELIPEAEKRESVLYKEANEILQNVVREMGIKRPVILEITRKTELNAFILKTEQAGGRMDDASARPLRVYVNAGMFTNMQKALAAKGQTFTRDHLAGILGHELQHLRQPRYNMDEPGKDAALSQRFEYDSDLVAMEAMDKAGYNPMAFIEMMNTIQKLDGNLKGALNHYFGGTHPLSENRVKDLLGEFHRPERVFFSADVEPQPFSSSVHGEAEAWTRDRLKKRLDGAQDWMDFDVIIEDIENDPRATFADVEITMSAFKVHLEARAVLSEAAKELETGALGLRDAMLYAANARLSGKPVVLDLWKSLVEANPNPGSREDNVPWYAVSMLGVLSERFPDSATHRDPALDGCLRTKVIADLVDGVYKDTFLVPETLADGPIVSLEQLYDPTDSATAAFWTTLPGNSWGNEKIPADRRAALLMLTARAFWLKRTVDAHYEGDDVAAKQSILAGLMPPTEPETSAMSPRDWLGAIGALSQRVATIEKEVAKVAIERPEWKKEKPRMNRGVYVDPFAGLPSTGADPVPGGDATQATRDRLLVQNRLSALARRLFDRELSAPSAEERLGSALPDAVEAKEWTFRRATTDFLFSRDVQTAFPVDTVAAFDSFSKVKDIFRILPTSLRRSRGYGLASDKYLKGISSVPDDYTTHIIGRSVRAEQKMRMASFRSEDIGDRLRDIRTIANTSLLVNAMNHGAPPGYALQMPGDESLLSLLGSSPDMETQKRELFAKWVRGGLGHGKSLHESAAEILGDRVPAPRSVIDPAESALGRALRSVRAAFESPHARNTASHDAADALKARNKDIAHRFAIAATNFYAAAFADNAQEIRQLRPGEIRPI